MNSCAVKKCDITGSRPWLPYVVPFAVFIIFTALGQYLPEKAHCIYSLKTVTVGLLLYVFRDSFRRDFAGRLNPGILGESVAAGLMVLAVWILSDDFFPTLGTPSGFNPASFGLSKGHEILDTAFRLLGAAAVVPVMEELFWRSFLMRYLIDADFQSVPLGTFTWFSFLGVAIVFGLEHYRVVQGIFAGVVYGFLVVRRKNLVGATVAHSVTNLGLGIYVLATGSWDFW